MKDEVDKLPVKADEPDSVDYAKDFFNKQAYLTVSGQLAVENYAVGLNNVYTFGPTFRAENSNTTRHLAEFWMIEPEMCFAGLDELFALTEGYVKFCIEYALNNIRDDIDFFNNVFKRKQKQKNKGKGKGKGKAEGKEKNFEDLVVYLESIVAKPFAKMEYTKAIEILEEAIASKKKKFAEKPYWGID
ncbi:MAG: amino acid--tRNA ligase-related protein, partial [Bacteroidota bacterium]